MLANICHFLCVCMCVGGGGVGGYRWNTFGLEIIVYSAEQSQPRRVSQAAFDFTLLSNKLTEKT